MQNKWILIAIITLFFSPSILAQISEGGIPPSFLQKEKASLRTSIIPKELTPLRSIEELKKEDEQVPVVGYPQRIGTGIPVEIDLYKDGSISELDNGDKIIRYTISAPNALGLMIYYSDFHIPEGGKLFIYSQDKEQVIGAFTYNTNPKTQKYATEAIFSDKITLEYLVSKTSEETPRIKIENISYIYNEDAVYPLKAQSQHCMIDINCAEGTNWQIQKRGVVKITMRFSDGVYVCSGSLVNNTKQDKTPYVLTADHCFFNGDISANFSQSTFTFNYERESCGVISNNKGSTITGSTFRARNPVSGGSDGCLVELSSKPSDDLKVYYNGWDVTGSIPNSGVIIHHPNGDSKKITTYTEKPRITGNIHFDGMAKPTARNSAWGVYYSSSVTEGGSSGSPIFNNNGLIIGTLSGGDSHCDSIPKEDFYGRLFYHWDKHTNTDYHFKKYLDPNNTGKTVLNGLNYDVSSIEKTVTETSKNIVVYPSPVLDELNVNCNDIIREISIIDIKGREVFNLNDHDSSTLVVPTSTWASGVYNITVKTSEGVYISEKVIKR